MDLDELLNDLGEAADGKRHLPVVTDEGASAVVSLFHAQIDRGTEARAKAATASGHPVACKDGCNACCNSIPIVFAGELVTIVTWLRYHPDVRAQFEEAYPKWAASLADVLVDYAAAAKAEDVPAAERALRAAWQRSVMCAFNQNGSCSIYDVRPAICRDVHALDTADHCQRTTSRAVATMTFKPLEDYTVTIRPIVLALHAALRPTTGARPLCVAVHDELVVHGSSEP